MASKRSAAAGNSLFDMYRAPDGRAARSSPPSRHRQHGTTRSAQLRSAGIRLTCYLNCEADNGRSTVVALPSECDSIEEVIPKIQQRMQLDKRMLYIAELFTVVGEPIRSYQQIIDAAKADSPVIVGCGEPFDESHIPDALLEYHLNGEGRKGVKSVNKELKDKRKRQQAAKAQRVREQGFGVTPHVSAAAVAKQQQQQDNHEKAEKIRHRYMDGLVQRANQQQAMMHAVRENIKWCKMEAEESRLNREQYEQDRLDRLAEERAEQILDFDTSKREAMERAQRLHDKVKGEADEAKFSRQGPPLLW